VGERLEHTGSPPAALFGYTPQAMRATRAISICLVAAGLGLSSAARADAEDPVTLPPGGLNIVAAGGAMTIDREWTWNVEASLRLGLPAGIELAAPLALGVRLIGDDRGSGIVLGVGIVDLWVTRQHQVLVAPAVVLAAHGRIASSASLRVGLDLTGVEQWNFVGEHPGWLRGALALVIDMGPFLTIAGGISHQRLAMGQGAPRGTRHTGWVGDARFSAGAVRTEPFCELPTLAIHAMDWLDVIALVRVDVDTDRRTTDLRLLAGLRVEI
jgi:hypothetical protein